jgi:hypothetical protein
VFGVFQKTTISFSECVSYGIKIYSPLLGGSELLPSMANTGQPLVLLLVGQIRIVVIDTGTI